MKLFAMLSALMIPALMITGAQAQEVSDRDKIHIAVQEICPISGEKLGAHGDPVKAKFGEQEMFLCCKACLEGEVDEKHWATIHANFAKAQGICPVMKKELPKKPKWTIVKGHVFYVCCPPCTDKIEAAPEDFVAQLDELYKQALAKRGVKIE